jgi:hypothetical protein
VRVIEQAAARSTRTLSDWHHGVDRKKEAAHQEQWPNRGKPHAQAKTLLPASGCAAHSATTDLVQVNQRRND